MTKWLAGILFGIGVVFWAGSTYNRISGIESQLVDIKAALPTAARVAVIDTRLDQMQREIEALKRRER
jgi:hypothetical protein